jgi:serine/threonine protein kinase/Tfp pilus assembly protein PilF
VNTEDKRICQVCGTVLSGDGENCPVCALRGALTPNDGSFSASDLHFEHYQVLKHEDGTPIELGRGAMGITYKAVDAHLRCLVTLKLISAKLVGDPSVRRRFVREAQAAASVRHPNVASVFHLGESGGSYFYAMEFVEGETLEKLIRRLGKLEPNIGLEVTAQVAAGLAAIQKQHLVHRDIKPSNIMVSFENGRLENVKIIDLGLAKGVAEEDTISALGSFTGTPQYASPEQFSGIKTDIRSDLYSLGITLWEMLSGELPFQGSAVDLMYQHQHAALPVHKLQSAPAPIVTLLEVLLAKELGQRFQDPIHLQKALNKVREAWDSESRLTAAELRSISDQRTQQLPKQRRRKRVSRRLVAAVACATALLLGWTFLDAYRRPLSLNQASGVRVPTNKSIAVLPFENISPEKDDAYFADGVQDEILNNLARIAELKVISRTSVMQYRVDNKRDLRQIADALGVSNVLEGTVRRNGNRVRVSAELIDARSDDTIWADSYDRDLTNIFAIQSEVAQNIADKLAAKLSPEEKKRIEAKPTENLEAYDLYLRANQLLAKVRILNSATANRQPLLDAISLLERAVQLDPQFALAYCALTEAQDRFYSYCERTTQRRALGDDTINTALRLRPDLPEARHAYGAHLLVTYRDYARARAQLAIARHDLPNNSQVIASQAFVEARQGNFEKAIQGLEEAINIDPLDAGLAGELGFTLFCARQFRAVERAYDQAIAFFPDNYLLKVRKAWIAIQAKGDSTGWSALVDSLPSSELEETEILSDRIYLALGRRDWGEAERLLAQLNEDVDASIWTRTSPIPRILYTVLIARLQGESLDGLTRFLGMREELGRKIAATPLSDDAISNLAVLDALLGRKQEAIAEAKHAAEILPISTDAVEGPPLLVNLAMVYAWCNESDLAFAQLNALAKTPRGIYAGSLMLEPLWDPIRQDPRFEKLLAEITPREQ